MRISHLPSVAASKPSEPSYTNEETERHRRDDSSRHAPAMPPKHESNKEQPRPAPPKAPPPSERATGAGSATDDPTRKPGRGT
jgi:hypothetical protein